MGLRDFVGQAFKRSSTGGIVQGFAPFHLLHQKSGRHGGVVLGADGCAVKFAEKDKFVSDVPAVLVQSLIDAGYLAGEKSEGYQESKSRHDPAQSNPAGEANGGSIGGPIRPNLVPNPVTNPHDGALPAGETGTVNSPENKDGGDEEVTREQLEGLTMKELHEIADEEGIDVSEAKRKAELVDLIYAHLQKAKETDEVTEVVDGDGAPVENQEG